MFLHVLIFFFIYLIGYQIVLANQPIIEGATTYKESSDPAVKAYNLSVENSGNIAYLKERVDKVDKMDKEVNDLKGRMDTMEKQMQEIGTQNKNMAESLPGVKEEKE